MADKNELMPLRMDPDEEELFVSFLSAARSYTEFGAGGSTVLASSLVRGPIVSLDSSIEWLNLIELVCGELPVAPELTLVYADIGPVGHWGKPVDESCRARWPDYAKAIWQVPKAARADLFLIDGRFRVSCAVETLLRCRADAVVLVHDFANRPGYQVIRHFFREVATASTLSAFVRKEKFSLQRAQRVAKEMRFVPD